MKWYLTNQDVIVNLDHFCKITMVYPNHDEAAIRAFFPGDQGFIDLDWYSLQVYGEKYLETAINRFNGLHEDLDGF